MEAKFTIDDTKMNVNLEDECHTFEIWNIDHWNIIILNNEQIHELSKLLTKWKAP